MGRKKQNVQWCNYSRDKEEKVRQSVDFTEGNEHHNEFVSFLFLVGVINKYAEYGIIHPCKK
jgi:hypothetical protein